MTERVFTGEYFGADFRGLEADRDEAKLALELAEIKLACARILESGGHMMHTFFIAGDEPKWKVDFQRSAAIEHNEGLGALAVTLFGEKAA